MAKCPEKKPTGGMEIDLRGDKKKSLYLKEKIYRAMDKESEKMEMKTVAEEFLLGPASESSGLPLWRFCIRCINSLSPVQ